MKIIITDCDHDNIEIEEKVFAEAGLTVELKNARTEDEVIAQCGGGEILIVQYAQITEKVMQAIPSLKYVVRYGVGVDTVDLKAAEQYGVRVGNVPDYGMNEVADQALAFTLALTRKLVRMNQHTKTKEWNYLHSVPLHRFSEMTVGVVGLGRIGRNYAKKAAALGFRVIGTDPRFQQEEQVDSVSVVSFDELVESSDVISIHCPADGNLDLFRHEVFRRMKNSAVIVNAARGGIINEDDLDQALADGEIAGAGLDCMASEPMRPDSPIFRHENLLVTPHMAWYSEEAALELKRKVAEESVRFARGEKIHYPVNRIMD